MTAELIAIITALVGILGKILIDEKRYKNNGSKLVAAKLADILAEHRMMHETLKRIEKSEEDHWRAFVVHDRMEGIFQQQIKDQLVEIRKSLDKLGE